MKQMKAVKSFCSEAEGTHKKGSVFYADDARADELKNAGLAVVIDDLGSGDSASATDGAADAGGGKRKPS